MIDKIQKYFRIFIAIYVMFFCYIILFNGNVYINEFANKIGIVQKYSYKVITHEDSQKFDRMLSEEMSRGKVTEEKLKEIKAKIEGEVKKKMLDISVTILLF